ncbi:MAG: GemA protein [Alkaliphilus sp.]|nr:MAG: GemA protein [Alkaliphilus sp.]
MSQIKSIWGLAGCEEVNLNKEELYAVVYSETKKESISKLSVKEKNKVIAALIKIKENRNKREGMASREQIWKINELSKELGWNDNPHRLKAFVKKYYQIENINWLDARSAWRLIESLKKMLKKGKTTDEE